MIRVRVFNAHPNQRISSTSIVKLARRVFKSEKALATECNLIFVDDERMTDLNRTYLHRRYVTDVITFPFSQKKKNVKSNWIFKAWKNN